MINFLWEWILAVWIILCDSGPFLLAGFVIAGFLKAWIPDSLVFRHLGQNRFRSVAIASVAGAPLPLCSCSVIPSAISLKKSGASKGATTSFLVSTPETGVDSIGVTWALMDPIMTVVRPIAAIVTAMFSGAVVNVLVRRGLDDPGVDEMDDTEEMGRTGTCCGPGIPDTEPGREEAGDFDEDCGHEHESGDHPKGILATARYAVQYAFGPLLDDLTPWFILGIVISGLIAVVVPDGFFETVAPGRWIPMVAMLLVGVPMYICATSSTPLAAVLMAKGLDPGAALVLLLAGPATNVATIAVVRQFLGKRVLWVYLGSIAIMSLLFGRLISGIYEPIRADVAGSIRLGGEPGAIAILSGAALVLLLARSSLKLGLPARAAERARQWLEPVGIDPTSQLARGCVAAVLAAAYLWTGVTVVLPGETVFALRFGKVRAVYDEPGAHLHLPYPFIGIERLRKDEIRGLPLGIGGGEMAESPGASRRLLASALKGEATVSAEVITGDENLLKLTASVHYRTSDAYRYRYAVADPAELVRGVVEASLRSVVAGEASDELLVANRETLQARIVLLAQKDLDAIGSGVEMVALFLLDVHAPPEVHEAFRDVASALEDKEREHRRAERYQVERVARARSSAFALEEKAHSSYTQTMNEARAEAHAFEALLEAYREAPEVTRKRLQLAGAESSLRGRRLLVLLGDEIDVTLMKTRSDKTGSAAKAATMADD